MENSSRRRPKILVMDDSDIVLDVTQEVLEDGGYDVVTVSSPELLPTIWNDEKPDLALIDVSMPVMSGQSVIELMRRTKLHRCPLVLYSEQPELRLEALSELCGAAGYICKTADAPTLLKRVRDFLPAGSPADQAQDQVLRIFAVSEDAVARADIERAVYAAKGESAYFESGEQCLAALRKQRPALIFVDLEMSPVPGDIFCRKLREDHAGVDVPVVMLSGATTAVQVMRTWRVGGDDLLRKPLSPPALAAKISAARRAALGAPPAKATSSQCILLVEHAALYRNRLGRMLECSGHRVLYARSPEQTFVYAKEYGKSLAAVAVDLTLPGIEPIELLGTVKQLVHAPIFGLTEADSGAELPRAAVALTGYPVVDKRLPLSHAVSEINVALRKRDELGASERVPFFSMIDFRALPEGEWMSGFSSDLSASGIFVTTLTAAPVGATLEMKIAFPGWGSVACKGLVVWSNELAPRTTCSYMVGMGVKFVDSDASFADLLRKYATPRSKTGPNP
jgi:DNA-binding response OmpR family regulator